MEKQNIIYPPEFFIKGMRVIPKKWLKPRKEGIVEKITKDGIIYWGDYIAHSANLDPILPKFSFTPEMLTAVLSGRKTKTTRKAKTQSGSNAVKYKVGDVICLAQKWGRLIESGFPTTWEQCEKTGFDKNLVKWQPQACTMPNILAKHFIRITNVELKKPCEFTDKDILAEGIFEDDGWGWGYDGVSFHQWGCPQEAWEALIKSIHGKDFETFWNEPQIVYTFELIKNETTLAN